MKKNVASQNISAQMTTVSDGSDFTGTVTVTVTKDNGTQTASAGTVTNKGGGETNYAPTQAETNADFISFNFAGTGAITTGLKIYTTFPQTGDNFTRLGAPAGASVSADIAVIEGQTDDIGVAGAGLTDLGGMSTAMQAEVNAEVDTALTDYDGPTNAEMEARTILAANYLQPTVSGRTLDVTAAGTGGIDWANVENQSTTVNLSSTNIDPDQVVASVSGNVDGSVASVTAGVAVSTINANVIDAASIATSAMDGKGDWNIGKTGYTLTQAFPSNFADMSITLTTGLVDITQAAADKSWSTTTRVLTAGTNLNDLSASQVNNELVDVLTVDTFGELSSVPGATSTILDKISWSFTINRNEIQQTSTSQSLKDNAGTSDIGTRVVSDDGTTTIRGKYS